MINKSKPPFDWVDWYNVVQTAWLFHYFSDTVDGECTRASIMLWFEQTPIEKREKLISNAKKAWAVKKHRSNKGKPLQIYLSATAQNYLTKTSRSLTTRKDDLIEKMIHDQSTLHHKEMATSKKLRAQNKILMDQIQRLHVIRIATLVERSSLNEELSKARSQLLDLENKLNKIQIAKSGQPPETT